MLTDEPIQNSILFRPNSKVEKSPFLVSLNNTSFNALRNESQKFFANSNIAPGTSISKTTTGGCSRKSIKIVKPETIKRANNDAWMAASVGDLDWLKQTFKISAEIVFDKNGFATIHLACIHGRLNIIKYLIEDKMMDINLPSLQGWRPIHLCISNQIGSRAVECLKYLISKGADVNVKNNDGVYPLHMAASEGIIECLKILVELNADTTLTDNRGQTALDLAKLWGHKNCAKILSKEMWHSDKKLQFELITIEKQRQTQEILKQIEKAHFSFYDDKELSERKFDNWLINQGFDSEKSIDENKINKSKESLCEISKENDRLQSNKDVQKELAVTESKVFFKTLSLPKSKSTLLEKTKNEKSKLIKPILKKEKETDNDREKENENENKHTNNKPWNYSTKSAPLNYIPNLGDVYPRDSYTFLPKNSDLIFLSKELKGMSLEKVKEFMTKNLTTRNINLSYDVAKDSGRPVYFRPKNIIDADSKIRMPSDMPQIDEAGLNFYQDSKAFPYREVKKLLLRSKESEEKKSYGNYNNTKNTLKLIKNSLSENNLKDEKLQIVERLYGRELCDFMTNKRHGLMSQRFEKVYIC